MKMSKMLVIGELSKRIMNIFMKNYNFLGDKKEKKIKTRRDEETDLLSNPERNLFKKKV